MIIIPVNVIDNQLVIAEDTVIILSFLAYCLSRNITILLSYI